MTRKIVRKPNKTRPAKASKPAKRAAPKRVEGPAAQTDDFDTLVTASAQALKLPIDPAWRSGVKFNLQLIFRLAALVDDFPLPDDAEPGPVFYA